MGENRNFAALDWVTQEIDETLSHARDALEDWANDPNDKSKIRFCLGHIHQVHGSLQMVEFYGAALLAEELEHLAQALCDEKAQYVVDAQEALMRGIVQLPKYLDYIKTHRDDQPAMILPLLNDLRAVRGESLLSESRLFNPDLKPATQFNNKRIEASIHPSQFLSVLKKLQQMYQFAAAAIIRGVKVNENIVYLNKVLARQYKLTSGTANQPLWEISLALVEALEEGGLELTASVKLLLRQLNRQFKILLHYGVAGLDRKCDEELLKNLLFYVAISTQHGRFVSKIREKYKLGGFLNSDSDTPVNLQSAPDTAAIRSVVAALKEELRTIKFNLDDCLTSDTVLDVVKESFPIAQRVADTLAILGVGDIRKQMLAQVSVMESILGTGEYSEQQLFNLASEMIDIESRLDALTRGVKLARNDIDQQKAQQLTLAQDVVLAESRNGLEQTKDCIIEYIASQWDQKHLEGVPKLLREIRGGLEMVPLSRAAQVLGGCAEFIEKELLVGNQSPEWRVLDTLADAIASIEYYLEHLSSKDGQNDDEMLLAVAEDSVRNLGIDLSLTTNSGSQKNKMADKAADTHAEPSAIDIDEAAKEEAPAVAAFEDPWRKMLSGEYTSPQESEETIETKADSEHEAEQDLVDEDQLVSNEPATPATVEADSEPVARDEEDLIDDEIIEIFIEEAEEVKETIAEYFPRWSQDFNDSEALIEFRRGFHTLKGSGRMVGASDIGELAWAIENMLNRVLDKTIKPDVMQVELINRVLALLPSLIESFSKNRPNPQPELCRQYMSWADEIASGSEPEALLNPAEEKSQKKTVSPGLALDPSSHQENVDLGAEFDQSHPESESVLAINDENLIETSEPEVDDDDETLLWEIFSAEAQGHLEVIQEYIDEMDDAAPVFEAPSDPMQRALHTLKGSAHMAEVGPIAQLVGPFESFVKELRSYQLAIDEDILTLVKDGVAYIHLVLDQISHNEALDIPKLDQFLARVSELRDKTIGPIVRQQDASQQAKPVDPELLSIFMAEEMNLLLDADVYLEKWRQDQISQAEVHAILNELHLLVQGAKRANYPDMAQLSSLLERLYHVALDGSLNRTSRFYEVLNRGHDFLLDMIDSVAAGQNLPPLSMQLRAEMELLLDEAKANALRADQSLIQSSDADDEVLEDEILEEDEVLAELETFDSSDLTLVDESELDDSEEQPASAVGYESSEEPIASFDVELVDETDEDVEADLNQVNSESPSAPESRVGSLDDASWFTVGFTPKTTSEPDQAENASAQDSELVESADDLESEDDLYLTADVSGEQVQDIHDFTEAESESEFVVILEENQDIVDQAHNEEIPTLLSPDDDVELIDAEQNFVDDTTEVHEEFALEDDETLIDDIPILEIEDESTGEILDSPLKDESLVSEQYAESNDLEFIDEDLEDEILSEVEAEAFTDAEAAEPEYENIDLDAGETLEVIDDNALIDDDMDSIGLDEDSSIEVDETSELADLTVDDLNNTEQVNQVINDEPEVASIRSSEPLSSGASAQPLETAEHLSDLELDNDIVEIFAEESSELLEEIDVSVHDWMEDWTREDCSEKLKRLLHTFKGSARLAGLMGLGEAAHEFESYLIKEGRGELDDGFFNKVNAYYELLYTSSDKVQNYLQQQPVAGLRKLFIAGELDLSDLNTNAGLASSPAAAVESADVEPELPKADESYDTSVDDEPLEGELTLSAEPIHVSQAQTITSDSISNVVPFAPRKTLQETPQQPLTPIRSNERLTAPPVQTLMGAQIAQRGAAQESVKVAAELLEELVNLAGETSISRARMEEQVNEIGYTLDEMDFTIDRLQEQLRRLDIETEAQILFRQEQMEAHEDFDPLEMDRYSQLQQLSRSLMESASDLIDLKDTLSNKTRDTETLLLQQSRINTELQEGLMRSRMVPFSRLVPRLRRIVRQISTELGKRVNFELDNIEGELDRTMLERMVAPLEHMLRNAVDHGIEMPEVRVSNGKNEVGTIRLGLGREGGDVILRLSDDGRGINIARVRDKAIERGLMTKDAELSDKDIMQFILHAGFSTAEKVTQISGRGVGMDVVNAEIKQLGGSVSINSQEGRGSEFIMRLPFTLSVNRALMVVIGEDYYAVPLNTIEGIVRVSPYELEHYYNTPDARFEYAGQQYQVKHLGNLLDENHRYQVEGHALPLPVLLVRSQEYSVALQVDGLMGSREIVVKSLGPQFNGVDGLSGATVMGDGSVVVILDLLAFVRRLVAQSYMIEANAEHKSGTNLPEKEDIVRTVIIVDDSVTVRKVTSRFLEREGFDVMTAKDGVDAIRQLQDRVPDVMLLDIEMPRMDGFEVAKNVRSTSHLKDLPIIMITSRTGSKHRERAYELGVNHYLGKPYQEDDLLYHINLLTGQAQIQD
ncbi:Hpt domain-containing protein [Sessilibacter sp. MAH4]